MRRFRVVNSVKTLQQLMPIFSFMSRRFKDNVLNCVAWFRILFHKPPYIYGVKKTFQCGLHILKYLQNLEQVSKNSLYPDQRHCQMRQTHYKANWIYGTVLFELRFKHCQTISKFVKYLYMSKEHKLFKILNQTI